MSPSPLVGSAVLQPSSQTVADVNGSQYVPLVGKDIEVATTSPKTIVTYFNVFFANITMWGPTAQHYFSPKQPLNKYQTVGFPPAPYTHLESQITKPNPLCPLFLVKQTTRCFSWFNARYI